MIDYTKAFEQGLNAYHDVERATREVNETLKEFAEQVSRASGQKVHIRQESFPRPGTGFVPQTLHGPRMIPQQPYLALMAHPSATSENGIELCRYTLAPTGYPVRLRYSDTETVCADRAELMAGLQDLLSDPWAGGVFSRAMRSNDPAPAGG